MRRFLTLALSLILVSGCAPAQPVDGVKISFLARLFVIIHQKIT